MSTGGKRCAGMKHENNAHQGVKKCPSGEYYCYNSISDVVMKAILSQRRWAALNARPSRQYQRAPSSNARRIIIIMRPIGRNNVAIKRGNLTNRQQSALASSLKSLPDNFGFMDVAKASFCIELWRLASSCLNQYLISTSLKINYSGIICFEANAGA